MPPIKLKKEHPMLPLFEKFIQDSRTGRRLQPNGARISEGTLKNYGDTLRLLRLFSEKKEFSLRLYDERRLSARQTEREATYWKRFYRRFTEFLYREQGYFDNYIGSVIKNVRTFFNYLNKHTSVRPGPVYRLFYVRKEEVPIFPLLPEELNYLISMIRVQGMTKAASYK